MTTILAIDPGLTGALAVYMTDNPDRIAVYDMPVVDGEINPHELCALVKMWQPDWAIIERVGPMPRDGVKQAWRFSAAYTTATVCVRLMEIKCFFVTPAMWKRSMKVAGGQPGKEACRKKVIELFPACAKSFSRKKDQGRAEAALLAVYAYQQLPPLDRKHDQIRQTLAQQA